MPRFGRDRMVSLLLPVLVAVVVSALVLLAIGENPLSVFGLMLTEGFGGTRRIAATLSAATPLVFTSVATALCFRAGVFNVGADGAFVLGGLAAVTVGFGLPASLGLLLLPLAIVAAAVVGLVWMWIPGWLLARRGVDEVVSTLMLNFVAAGIAGTLVNGPLLSAASGNNVTPPIHAAAALPRLMPPSTLHAGFLIALAVLLAYAVWSRRTPAGFEGGLVGLNPRFARAVGISVPRAIILAMVLSGLVAGIGGAAHGLGQLQRFSDGFSAGYGFTGLAIALLARNNPWGLLAGSVLFGALASAGTTIQLFTAIPLDLVDVIAGTIMIVAVIDARRLLPRQRGAS
ncbi:MAG: ABC transporter permease [Rubellimicrobium sp.]|nr:ABC transporter permease [Rubellimicrobium sp.]